MDNWQGFVIGLLALGIYLMSMAYVVSDSRAIRSEIDVMIAFDQDLLELARAAERSRNTVHERLGNLESVESDVHTHIDELEIYLLELTYRITDRWTKTDMVRWVDEAEGLNPQLILPTVLNEADHDPEPEDVPPGAQE